MQIDLWPVLLVNGTLHLINSYSKQFLDYSYFLLLEQRLVLPPLIDCFCSSFSSLIVSSHSYSSSWLFCLQWCLCPRQHHKWRCQTCSFHNSSVRFPHAAGGLHSNSMLNFVIYLKIFSTVYLKDILHLIDICVKAYFLNNLWLFIKTPYVYFSRFQTL